MKLSDLITNEHRELKRHMASGNNIMYMGAPGLGKSMLVEQFTKQYNLGYVELILSQVEAIDIRGMMVPHRVEGRLPDTVSTRTPLAAMVAAEQAKGVKGGIIFFDEYYQAGIDNRKAVSQFLTSRRIGDWDLPEGWVVWGASNPPEWRAGTVPPMGHEKSRWQEFNISPDPEAWLTWANTAGIHHLYQAFANKFPQEVFVTKPPAERAALHNNPRAFVTAHNYHSLGVVGNELPMDAITQEGVRGAIGDGAARALFGFLKVQDVMPSPEDMLSDPTGCKMPPRERLDARYACMMQAAHYAGSKTNEALFEFVKRLDKEMTVSAIKHFVRKDPLSINAPNIAQFIAENPESAMSLAR